MLVGHSMGGGLAVWAAASRQISGLDGVVVIDVVEGTALAALPHMKAVLNSRPKQFRSVEEAVGWAVRSGMCKSKEAAGVSVPSQLHQVMLGRVIAPVIAYLALMKSSQVLVLMCMYFPVKSRSVLPTAW